MKNDIRTNLEGLEDDIRAFETFIEKLTTEAPIATCFDTTFEGQVTRSKVAQLIRSQLLIRIQARLERIAGTQDPPDESGDIAA